MRFSSFALIPFLGLYLSFACSPLLAVEHPDGSFATPDNGNSGYVSFKHIDNTNAGDYPYGVYILETDFCDVDTLTYCVTDCSGLLEQGTATLASIPTSDIAVSSLVFNAVGVDLTDLTSNFCAVLDGAGNVWAIDRDLPTLSNITTANSLDRIIPCEDSDIFSPETGCQQPPRPEISISGGFIQLDSTFGWTPHEDHCSIIAHLGRMVADGVGNRLFICTTSGWTFTSLTPLP